MLRNCLVLAVACGLLWFVWPVSRRVPEKTVDQKTDKAAKAWLEDLRKGGDGSRHWRSDGFRKLPQFFAVASYEVLDVPLPGRHVVRIHSSRQDGSPLVRVYEVVSDGDKVYRVTAQGDDPDEELHQMIRRGVEAARGYREGK